MLTDKLLQVFLACLLWPCTMVAQSPVFHHYTVEDGLPSSLVYQALQDEEGYMWFATDRGLARFDGYEFETFGPKDGLPSNDIWGMKLDNQGRMWLATFNEVVYYKDREFHTVPRAYDTPEIGKIESYQVDDKGNVFLTTGNGLLMHLTSTDSIQVFEKKWQQEIRRNLFGYAHVFFAHEDNRGSKWYYVVYGESNHAKWKIFKQNYADTKIHFVLDISPHDSYKAFPHVVSTMNDGIQFYSSNALYEFNANNLSRTSWEDITKKTLNIISIRKTSNSNYILTSSDGYCILDDSLKLIHNTDFLNQFRLNTLLKDKDDNLWVATSNNGIFFYSANTLESCSYSLQHSSLNTQVLSIARLSNGEIWLGTNTGQLFSYKKDKIKELHINNGKNNIFRIMALIYHPQTQHLIGATDIGTIYLNNEALSSYSIHTVEIDPKKHRLSNTNISKYKLSFNLGFGAQKALDVSRSGKIAMAGGSGVYSSIISEGEMSVETITNDQIPCYAIAFDSHENVWIGRKDGIFVLREDTLIDLRHKCIFFSYPINDLTISSKDYIWAATDGHGLFRFKEGNVNNIIECKNEIIKSIHIDKDGHVWAASNNGAKRIIVTNENPFTYSIFNITRDHGLPDNETNSILSINDTIFVGTQKGLTILNNKKFIQNPIKSVPYFISIKVNKKNYHTRGITKLEYYQNRIEINYLCLSFKSLGKVNYHYKMEGLDSIWTKTPERTKEYTSLPTGQYTFRLKAEDINGQMSEEKSITFIISPPWWETWWAIIAYFIVGASLVYLFIRWRVKTIEQKAKEQSEINKRYAAMELQALQSQMNPHFVFNAMQSIQHFIFKKDERTANKYMVRFSRLMRLFLESSRSRYIPLKDELQMLQFYIELEHMRFPDKFDFQINVADKLETGNHKLPSLLIQPFIENAINHGLIQLKTKGKLTVDLFEKDGYLLCTIDDNGIGRERAKKLRKESFKHHKSRGMQIVEDRINAMNEVEDLDIQINVFDKKDNNGNALGTKVEIRIPLQK